MAIAKLTAAQRMDDAMNHLSPLIDPRERQLARRLRVWPLITFLAVATPWIVVYVMWRAL